MKKGIALFLCIILLAYGWTTLIFAAGSSSQDVKYSTLRDNSVTYTCDYDMDTSKIAISGTVNHDVMIMHSEYNIEVYKILPGETVSDVLSQADAKPLATSAIAIKFQFSISAVKTVDRYSRYAIVLVAKNGEKILAAEPQYAGIQTTYQYDAKDRSAFKGIHSPDPSITSNLGFGTAVVPVYLDRILSQASHGYLYPIEDSYRYFDQSYVDELDAMIRSYSASGTRIYLQFLLSASGSEMASANGAATGATYDMPNVFSENVLSLISAFSKFFAERYDSYQSGKIYGIIVGSQIDQSKMNYCGSLSIEEYAERYAFYVMVVANSARAYQDDLDIVIPLSDIDAYSNASAVIGAGDYAPNVLLETVLTWFEKSLSDPIPCNVSIESSSVPFQIANENLNLDGVIDRNHYASDVVSAEQIQNIVRYINGLGDQYQSAPRHILYLWSVPEHLSGDALASAYTYSYYRLLQEAEVSSFVMSLSREQTATAIWDIQNILRGIDTKDSFRVTDHLLPYFGVDRWSQIVSGLTEGELDFRTEIHSSIQTIPEKWTGSFSYLDFSSGNISDWFAGISCKNVKISYGADSVRGMAATMQNTSNSGYAEAICLYEYAENFVYTPYLKLTVAISDETYSSDALYEIKVTVGNETAIFTTESIVEGSSPTEIWLDLSQYNKKNMAKYIKISTRVLHGDGNAYTLWVYDLTGVSEVHSSEELDALISAERVKIRNQSLDQKVEQNDQDLLWMTFGTLCGMTVLAFALYIWIRYHRAKEQVTETDPPNSDSSTE